MEKTIGKVFKYKDDVDTDVIIPARYLNTPNAQELAMHCMEDIDPEFVKNVKKGDIIVAGWNFGCGSSREHAPWALVDYGIRAIIAPSFADIFKNNALGNGLLTIELAKDEVASIIKQLKESEDKNIEISLFEKKVFFKDQVFSFDLDEFRRTCLLEGLDNIALTLKYEEQIKAYEKNSKSFLV